MRISDWSSDVCSSDLDVVGGITVSSPLTSEQDPQTTRYLERAALGDDRNRNESVMVSGVGNIALGDYTLTSVTGYSWFNSMIVNVFDQTIPNSGGAFTNNSVYKPFPERFSPLSQAVSIIYPNRATIES